MKRLDDKAVELQQLEKQLRLEESKLLGTTKNNSMEEVSRQQKALRGKLDEASATVRKWEGTWSRTATWDLCPFACQLKA
eukprot:SAG22_NODE_1060_length_5764_cov_2.176876_6_plen_80_part_00